MLGIRKVNHLLRALGTSLDEMSTVLESPDSYYEELLLVNPLKSDKRRVVVNVTGAMRTFQSRLYKGILLPKLMPSVHSHGGVSGRSIKTNVQPHVGSRHVFKTDISNFYPSIHFRRIYRLFAESFQCSPDVARVCTKICTYKHHLSLGLITSPILADQVLSRVDRRIGGLCKKAGLTYTRFVDDISISGPYDLQKAGFAKIVETILSDDGFKANPDKHRFGRLDDGLAITNLREVRGHIDVRREYLDELIRQMDDLVSLARDDEFQGPFYTRSQILGRVRFVCWVNPGRRRDLIQRFRAIRWDSVIAHARERGLVVSRVSLMKLPKDGSGRPDRV